MLPVRIRSCLQFPDVLDLLLSRQLLIELLGHACVHRWSCSDLLEHAATAIKPSYIAQQQHRAANQE